MSVYFDASVVVSMFVDDAHTARVDAWTDRTDEELILSDWTVAEFSSALALRRRIGGSSLQERLAAEAAFDIWLTQAVTRVAPEPADFALVRGLIRTDAIQLKASDALHLAIALRLDAELATLDKRLAAAAADLGLAVSAL